MSKLYDDRELEALSALRIADEARRIERAGGTPPPIPPVADVVELRPEDVVQRVYTSSEISAEIKSRLKAYREQRGELAPVEVESTPVEEPSSNTEAGRMHRMRAIAEQARRVAQTEIEHSLEIYLRRTRR